jgi:ABC-2 type transport system ATP-binding protein
MGTVVKNEAAEAVLQVPVDLVNQVVGRALQSLPVTDLTVENPPLEEVMSELFSRSRAAGRPA